jgi:DNA-binding NtrC family response regulator
MSQKILIVEDQFIEANNLQMILEKSGYMVTGIARSVKAALELIAHTTPDMVLLDIFLQGDLTGIDLAKILRQQHIAFVYLSANSNKPTLDAAKATHPYGFLVKPYREKDVLVTLDVAWYLHAHNQQTAPAVTEQPAHRRTTTPAPPIIGNSAALQKALELAETAAPSDTSVLILGESGTGKELVARHIHNLSKRYTQTLVTVNCAALPANLIESELFGHERGAFTGAVEKRIGKFEQAAGSSLFLDEIGEMPFDLQAKLLRVLQEKEIERIGGREVIQTDVRIIAATNRNLEKEIADGRFRLDLYYRLNVFPIYIPALRERQEDILPLARYFIQQFARANHKSISNLGPKAEEALLQYTWPGNIRELENMMERCVLLCNTDTIREIPVLQTAFQPAATFSGTQKLKTITENERDHIAAALKYCNGKIFGKGGAAELLGINVSTLNSRIKKLGIEKNRPFSQG